MIDLSLETLETRMKEIPGNIDPVGNVTMHLYLGIQPNDRACKQNEKISIDLTEEQFLEFARMSPEFQKMVVLAYIKRSKVKNKKLLYDNHNWYLGRYCCDNRGCFSAGMMTDTRDNRGFEGLDAWVRQEDTVEHD